MSMSVYSIGFIFKSNLSDSMQEAQWPNGYLVHWTPDRAVRVRASVGALRWARHFALTVPLFTQVYKQMGTGEFTAGGNPAMD